MLGNCAVGRRNMAITPMITMRIEMTIATIGRRMKKFAMASFLSRKVEKVWDLLANLLESFHNHLLRGLNTIFDDPHVINALSYIYGPNAGLVISRYNCNLVAA